MGDTETLAKYSLPLPPPSGANGYSRWAWEMWGQVGSCTSYHAGALIIMNALTDEYVPDIGAE